MRRALAKPRLHVCTALMVVLMAPHLLTAEEPFPREIGRTQSGDLTLTLTESAVYVEGTSPEGEVAYLGANLVEHHESWGSLDTYSGVLSGTGADGRVELAPKSGISTASIWIVLDVASGEFVGASPSSFRKSLPDEMSLDVSSDREAVSVDRPGLEFLLYRPGVGVWFSKAANRGDGQGDADSGALRLELSRFQPTRAGGASAPTRLQSGDRLLALDPKNLDSASVTFR